MTHKVFCLNVKMKKRRTQVYVYKYVSITRKSHHIKISNDTLIIFYDIDYCSNRRMKETSVCCKWIS